MFFMKSNLQYEGRGFGLYFHTVMSGCFERFNLNYSEIPNSSN